MNSPIDWSSHFAKLARRVTPPEISWLMKQALETPGMISLAAGFVDQESLPNEAIAPLLHEMMTEAPSGQSSLQYGTTAGDLGLREHLAERMKKEGVFHPASPVDASHILIGSGSQQILYLAAEAFLDEDDIVLVEAPTYFVVLGVFKARGIRFIGIDTDWEGLNTQHLKTTLDQLEREGLLNRVKMLYLMSYSTNPTGITLSQARRCAVLQILNSYRDKGHPILLLEDGAYRRLSFQSPPPPSIKSMEEENELVLYTESFSKSLSPGLRLGFAAGPKAIIDKMVDIKGNHDFGTSNFCQQVLKRLLDSPFFDAHQAVLHSVYQKKRDLVLDILRNTFPPEAEWMIPDGGFYSWITLPPAMDTGTDGPIFKEALAQKVLYVPGALCYSSDRAESRHASAIRLSFGMTDPVKLQMGCERLGKALQRSMAGCR
ncbi:MAG: PLP-dependent aminotransferase family protein [bacterium]|jgi:2-aminoadipate transaminase|nr:PLP-dependent aminotransferase family protein [bacterium]